MFAHKSFFNVEIIFGNLLDFISSKITNEKILIVTSKSFSERGLISSIKNILKNKDICVLDSIKKEPSLEQLESFQKDLFNIKFDLIISIGGGSVIDTAKILSVTLIKENKIDRLSNFNKIKSHKNILLYSVPTTAGSGAELTSFATVWDYKLKKKYSLQSELLLPKLAFYDYKLLKSLNYSVSVSSGLDTISHAFESIWNKFADPLSISFATQSLSLSINSIRDYVQKEKKDLSLKEMQLASILSALAISRTKTGIAHSISYPLTSIYNIPHGIASSFVLPEVLMFNYGRDDGRLINLSRSLSYKNIDELFQEIIIIRKELLSRLEILNILKNIDIDLISKKLITPERANLNFVEVDEVNAIKILKDAVNRINELDNYKVN